MTNKQVFTLTVFIALAAIVTGVFVKGDDGLNAVSTITSFFTGESKSSTNNDLGMNLPTEVSKENMSRFEYGTTKSVPRNLNPQVQSVYEGLKKNLPERLTSRISKPFDYEGFKKNPKKILNIIEPGLVFRPHQPGKGIPRIKRAGHAYQGVRQGESVKLRVKINNGKAGQFVVFNSDDLGKFSNGLPTMNILTDSDGMAEVDFYGTEGTIGMVRILVASPHASGRVKLLVEVLRKDGTYLGELRKDKSK